MTKSKKELIDTHSIGLQKFEYALHIWKTSGYKKLIVLGADTITCARLDEFIDDIPSTKRTRRGDRKSDIELDVIQENVQDDMDESFNHD